MNPSVNLLTNEASSVAGGSKRMLDAPGSVQASIFGSGAVSASVFIEVSNDESQWLALGTITLSGTSSASDGFAYAARWKVVRARIASISGAGANVTCVMTGGV